MLHAGVGISFNYVKSVLAAAVTELERNQEKVKNSNPKNYNEDMMVIFFF